MRLIILALFTSAIFYVQTYVFLSDCTIGGVRDLDWIDDVDKSTGCLPGALRYVLLILVPIIWVVVSIVIWKKFKRKR